MTTSVRWTAQLHDVREVSLLGSADLDFWQERLSGEELTPVDRDGRATIAIVSAAGKFAGIRFRELSVSVVVASVADTARVPSYFLERAFNSNRFFAFCERVFFSTPYVYANVGVEHPVPTEISVDQNGRTLFRASMQSTDAPTTRRPTQEHEEAWMARIMLPSNGRSASSRSKMFFARICGITHVYPFIDGEDRLTLHEQADGDVFDALLKSHFAPVEWVVRSNATHSKSKTYNRKELAALECVAIGEQSHPPEPAAGSVSNGPSSPPAR